MKGKRETLPRRERRPEMLKQKKLERKKAREEEKREKKKPKKLKPTNAKNLYRTVAEEKQARQDTTEALLKVLRSLLPTLLGTLSKIEDPRNPKKIKHKITVLLLYGIIMFVFRRKSRREANRTLTSPQLWENLRQLIPELETMPHGDTLYRLLCDINVEEIQTAMVDLVRELMRKKKFQNFLLRKCYHITVDGTQKFTRGHRWEKECLERTVGKEKEKQFYVYMLEVNLVFPNGFSIPLLSECLENSSVGTAENKQDCEQIAFRRVAAKLKKYFPRLRIMLLLDGLYPTGPVMSLCRKYNWDFMIVLQDKSLPSVWEEVEGLKKIETGNTLFQTWGDRQQKFIWINNIPYDFKQDNRMRCITIHVVECHETWEEFDVEKKQVVKKTSKHAWVSRNSINAKNVHERCNLAARNRWLIENDILVEKHHGYQYEHCFAEDWSAMKGYHYLMRLGHLINVIFLNCLYVEEIVKRFGEGGTLDFLFTTLAGPWLDEGRLTVLWNSSCFQLRLVS